MKTIITICLTGLYSMLLHAQNGPAGPFGPEVLIMENFVTDPGPSMLPEPSGDDDLWVNLDVDQEPSLCVAEGPTPQGWYYESDLGFLNPEQTNNFAFTSCSFLDLPASQSHNRNWLIIRHLLIPDTTFSLCWRSLAFQGPMFLDGYKVLVSTATNLPSSGDFTDVLFEAAQMVSPVNGIGSLNLNAYNFSPGYIQANGYTDTTYYFLDTTDPSKPFYRGRLEPHVVSLKQYAGQSIYIAFLHDSDDDNLIQLDDIVVTNDLASGTAAPPSGIQSFQVFGNPSRENAYFSWSLKTAQKVTLAIVDQQGRSMLERNFESRQESNWHADIRNWPPGIYYCILQTPSGRATSRLVKI